MSNDPLGDLLGGASLAFLTSIVGLASSILFSWREKHQIHQFEKLRKSWVDGLDSRLRLITLEKVSQDSLSEHRRQSQVLLNFTEQLAFQLTEALERTVPKALDERVAAPLTQALEKLQTSVDEMARAQAKTSEETLRELVNKFSQSISGAAGEQMQEFADAVKVMSTQLQGQIEAVSAQQEEIRTQSQDSVRELAGVFQEGASTLQQQVSVSVKEILGVLSTTVSNMSVLLDTTAARMAEQLDMTAATFGKTVGTLNSSVGEIKKILDGANELMGYLDQLIAGTRKAHIELDRIAQSLRSSASSMQAAADKGSESVMLIQQRD